MGLQLTHTSVPPAHEKPNHNFFIMHIEDEYFDDDLADFDWLESMAISPLPVEKVSSVEASNAHDFRSFIPGTLQLDGFNYVKRTHALLKSSAAQYISSANFGETPKEELDARGR